MEVNQPSKQVQFRADYSWKPVPYNENEYVLSEYFRLPCADDEVKCRLSAYRFQSSYFTVLHVQVEKICTTRPYSAADITITLSEGSSKTQKIDDWHQDSSVFCFIRKVDFDQWYPDIKCDIDWYGFITIEEWKNAVNIKKNNPLEEQLLSPHHSDLIFVVGEQNLPAHRSILAYCSPIFCATFREIDIPYKIITLRLHNFDLETMKEVLTFLYTGKFVVDDFVTWASAIKVAQAYKFRELQNCCESKIAKFLAQNNRS